MSQPVSRPTYLLSLLTLVFLSLSVALYLSDQRNRRENAVLTAELDHATAVKQELKKKLQELDYEKKALEINIKFHEEKIQLLTQQLDQERAELKDAEAKLIMKDSEIERMRTLLGREREEKTALSERIDKQAEDVFALREQLRTMLKTKEELEKKARDLAENGPVSLGTIVVRQN